MCENMCVRVSVKEAFWQTNKKEQKKAEENK